MKTELDRLAFLIERDGMSGALDFSKRTLDIYRKCLQMTGKDGRKLHHASLLQFRRGFIESCVAFRAFLRGG